MQVMYETLWRKVVQTENRFTRYTIIPSENFINLKNLYNNRIHDFFQQICFLCVILHISKLEIVSMTTTFSTMNKNKT